MKIIFLIFILILFSSAVCAQTSNQFPGIYRWTDVVNLKRCYIDGSANGQLDKAPVTAFVGQKFFVVNTSGSNAIIKFLYYTSKKGKITDAAKFFTYNLDGDENDLIPLSATDQHAHNYGPVQVFFTVPIATLMQYAVRYTRVDWSLSAGALNFPFKYRFQKEQSDFSGNFNFGTGVGITIPHDSAARWNYSIIAGFSVSQIHIDSATADINQKELVSTNNFGAFSFSIGILAQYSKIQIGAFIGWDKLSRATNLHYAWHYQGKPWLSIGLGYAIFSDDKNTKTAKSTQ